MILIDGFTFLINLLNIQTNQSHYFDRVKKYLFIYKCYTCISIGSSPAKVTVKVTSTVPDGISKKISPRVDMLPSVLMS